MSGTASVHCVVPHVLDSGIAASGCSPSPVDVEASIRTVGRARNSGQACTDGRADSGETANMPERGGAALPPRLIQQTCRFDRQPESRARSAVRHSRAGQRRWHHSAMRIARHHGNEVPSAPLPAITKRDVFGARNDLPIPSGLAMLHARMSRVQRLRAAGPRMVGPPSNSPVGATHLACPLGRPRQLALHDGPLGVVRSSPS